MKRILIFFLTIFLCLSSQGQERSTWSIIPHIGVNLANISDAELVTNIVDDTETTLKGKTKLGFVVGTDIEYAYNNSLSCLFGLYYAQQGCKFDTYIESSTMSEIKISDHLHYLNFMLAPKLYVGSGFAFEVGVQAGKLLAAKIKIEESGEDLPGSDFKDLCHSWSVSIPVGVSFEYQQVQLGLRYHIPINKLYNNILNSDSKNNQLSFSVGYRFNL